MKHKKGYISIEALILTTLITVGGFAIFAATKDSMAIAAARTLGLDMRLTQDMGDTLDNSFGYESSPVVTWDSNDGSVVKNGISSGQIVEQVITLNIAQNQALSVGGYIAATASVTNAPSPTGLVSWTVVNGAENVTVLCTGAADCLSVNITAIRKGTAIVRASVQNNSAFKDIVFTIN